MSFPSVAAAYTPSAPYCLSYRDLEIGGVVSPLAGGLFANLITLEGIGKPPLVVTDTQRDLDQGQFVGIDVRAGRTITAQFGVTPDLSNGPDSSLQDALDELGYVFAPVGNTEYPLFLALPGGRLRACMARLRRMDYKIDPAYVGLGSGVESLGTGPSKGMAVVTIEWHASDPRWYDTPTLDPTIGLPTFSTGIGFPIDFPVSFGTGSSAGVLTVVNDGPVEMRPRLIFTGPLTTPQASNASIDGNPTLKFNVTLAAGDTLTVDTDWHTVTLETAGSSTPTSRVDTLVAGSTWWNLPPGPSTLQFTSGDSASTPGTMTVEYASAWDAI